MAAMKLRSEARASVPFLDLTAMSREVGEELDLVWSEVTASSSFIGGPLVERFERDWAAFCGRDTAVGVANGTDAIELTLRALGIGPGDEVIVPANTFVATAEGVVLAGASPRFADVDAHSLLVTPDTLAAAVTPRTAAVIVVELFGNMPDMEGIVRFAQERGLALIEDAAQAHGATWGGRRAGSFGVAACFSFYPGKNLGAFGDGGAIVMNRDLEDLVRSLADHGRANGSKYLHPIVGRNSRLDALQAAVLSVKLARLDRWNEQRRRAMDTYRRHLDPRLIRSITVEANSESVHHLNVVRIPERDRVRDELARSGIDTGMLLPRAVSLAGGVPGPRGRAPAERGACERGDPLAPDVPAHPGRTDRQRLRTPERPGGWIR